MERKPIQISAAGVENTSSTQCNLVLFALCDDGTIWELRDNTANPAWHKLPAVPQDQPGVEAHG